MARGLRAIGPTPRTRRPPTVAGAGHDLARVDVAQAGCVDELVLHAEACGDAPGDDDVCAVRVAERERADATPPLDRDSGQHTAAVETPAQLHPDVRVRPEARVD